MRTEKDNKKVMILGEEWELKFVENIPKNLRENTWGTSIETKRILRVDNSMKDASEFEDKEIYQKDTIRHEVLHAYFDECGAFTYSRDEKLIEMLEKLVPKMVKTFKELDCLE